jgi:peptidoglycan L-alanyl-D-glutamate endopeptidase CwlK
MFLSMTNEDVSRQNHEKLAAVNAELAEKCFRLIELAAKQGFTLLVTNGYRTIAQQNALYQIGRRGKPHEKIVTNAKGGESSHNFRRAVDFAFVVRGEVSWDSALYDKIGLWAKIVGLEWGGNWRTFKDRCHVEV